MPSFVIKMDKVPGLPDDLKMELRKYLVNNKEMGIHNVPRRFEVRQFQDSILIPLLFFFRLRGSQRSVQLLLQLHLALTYKHS